MNAKVRPRSSSLTSSPIRVRATTQTRPAQNPISPVVRIASARLGTSASTASVRPQAMIPRPTTRRRENEPISRGPRNMPAARPTNTVPNNVP